MNSIVVHYKELALKGRNRPWFIQHLVRNLRYALRGLDVTSVRSLMGRIDIEIGAASNLDSADARRVREEVRERVSRVFGIANFSYAGRATHDFDALAAAILTDLGQQRKLQIARLIADQANLLILDEPTNYVSFDVLEELEAALKLFPGPVIAASHDRRFIQQFEGEVWALENGHLNVDGYTHYVETQVQQA